MRTGARESSRQIFNNRPAKRQIKAAPARKQGVPPWKSRTGYLEMFSQADETSRAAAADLAEALLDRGQSCAADENSRQSN
jgi:hypothetical protein